MILERYLYSGRITNEPNILEFDKMAELKKTAFDA